MARSSLEITQPSEPRPKSLLSSTCRGAALRSSLRLLPRQHWRTTGPSDLRTASPTPAHRKMHGACRTISTRVPPVPDMNSLCNDGNWSRSVALDTGFFRASSSANLSRFSRPDRLSISFPDTLTTRNSRNPLMWDSDTIAFDWASSTSSRARLSTPASEAGSGSRSARAATRAPRCRPATRAPCPIRRGTQARAESSKIGQAADRVVLETQQPDLRGDLQLRHRHQPAAVHS